MIGFFDCVEYKGTDCWLRFAHVVECMLCLPCGKTWQVQEAKLTPNARIEMQSWSINGCTKNLLKCALFALCFIPLIALREINRCVLIDKQRTS